MTKHNEHVINLIGTGIRYWVFSPSEEEHREMAHIQRRSNKSWSELFFDFDFLKHLKRTHWSELSEKENKGFLILANNLIEIRKRNRLLEKFFSIDLVRQSSLIPLYRISESLLNFNNLNQFVILQHEKGLIAKYKIDAEKFDMNKLEFQLIKSKNENLIQLHLSELVFCQNNIQSSMDDAVITHLTAFKID